jgi:hypothetical protein
MANNFKQILGALSITIVATLSMPSPALAYLDPGSSSIILQALLAAAVGVSMAWKTLWYKVKSIFTRKGDSVDVIESGQEDDAGTD